MAAVALLRHADRQDIDPIPPLRAHARFSAKMAQQRRQGAPRTALDAIA
jgi:hypothetical protein